VAQIVLDEGAVETLEGEQWMFTAPAGGGAWTREIERDGRAFLRVRFEEIAQAGEGAFSVVLRDANFNVVRSYPRDAFLARPAFWSEVVPGDTIVVEVPGPAPVDLSFRIAEVAVQAEMAAPLSQVGENNLKEIYEIEDPLVRKVASGVAKLTLVKNGRIKSCTGWLVADDLLLTNEHCIANQAECETAVAMFGYQRKDATQFEAGEQFACKTHEAGQHARDFALLRLDGSPGASERWQVLRPCDRALVGGEKLAIVQHPGGLPKMAVVEECAVKAPSVKGRTGVDEETDFSHVCDTQRGSSGSPVLDDKQEVVGLHHLGFGTSPFADVNRAVKLNEILPLIGIASSCTPPPQPSDAEGG
jgi:S1-C subfamily serine protease